MRNFQCLGAVLIFLVGCNSSNNSSQKQGSSEDPKKPAAVDLQSAKPDFTLTAKDFTTEFAKDSKAAQEKYKGKVIELTGQVSLFSQTNGTPSVVLVGDKDKVTSQVSCYTTEREPWDVVASGETIKLKGKLPEFAFAAALSDCVIVDAGKSKSIELTADQLAKEYATDNEATTKKYDGKFLIVSGEIIQKDCNEVGACGYTLKTTEKVKMKCAFTGFDKELTKNINVGQKIRVVGQYTLNFGTEEVNLYFCCLSSKPAK